jgi:hypothetical protein
MRIPEALRITIKVSGQPAPHMMAMLKFVTARKNPYCLVFGPSDRSGLISLTREQIISEAQKEERLFIMDYAGLEKYWTGALHVTPMNHQAIARARDAHRQFSPVFPYSENYKEALDAADAALALVPGEELCADVQCEPREGVQLESLSVLST